VISVDCEFILARMRERIDHRCGDVAVCEEAKRVLPWVETVAVKDGIDKYSAILKHPEVAAAEIREATPQQRPCPAGAARPEFDVLVQHRSIVRRVVSRRSRS